MIEGYWLYNPNKPLWPYLALVVVFALLVRMRSTSIAAGTWFGSRSIGKSLVLIAAGIGALVMLASGY